MTPRLIFARHGQTEWSLSGQHTSTTDIDLTAKGVEQVKEVGRRLVGEGKFIDPKNLKYIISSPRTRAKNTVALLLHQLSEEQRSSIKVIVDEDIQEWKYGDYEGMLTKDIKALRKERGFTKEWSIWSDGCENGEEYVGVTERLDRFIKSIKDMHRKAFDDGTDCDIFVVAHGHILRCLVARWLGREININPQFLMDTAAVGVLSYEHNNINEPAISLSGAFGVII